MEWPHEGILGNNSSSGLTSHQAQARDRDPSDDSSPSPGVTQLTSGAEVSYLTDPAQIAKQMF
jgi:hypothetical protein